LRYAILAAIVMPIFMGCSGPRGAIGAPGPVGPPAVTPDPVVDTVEEQVKAVLDEENAYRLGLGQTMLSPGLSCALSTFTSGDRIQASIAGHNTLAGLSSVGSFLLEETFNQPNASVSDGLNVLPASIRGIYLNLFLLRCQGQIVVTETGYYLFEMSSDDAGLLYVGGSKIIDLDNSHGMQTALGMKYLRKGVHAFRVDFAQSGGGSQALIVKMGGELIDPRLYVH
jgi:hypothetical protein